MSTANLLRLFAVVGLVALGLFLFWPQLVVHWSSAMAVGSERQSSLGQFGDMFGALTALFSTLTFLALLVTLLMERETNREQHALITKQAFESTYFHLLRVFQDSRPAELLLSARPGENQRHLTTHVAIQLAAGIASASHRLIDMGEQERQMTLWEWHYKEIYEVNQDTLGPFFRALYHWLKFVRESGSSFGPREERRYANMARAQLSNAEAVLLAVNCLAYSGSGLTEFVYRYSLLKHLSDPHASTAIRQVMERLYPSVAFSSVEATSSD